MRIIQLAVAMADDSQESLYALTDTGEVLVRRWAMDPMRNRAGQSLDGWTEGWVKVADNFSEAVKLPDSL